MLRKRRKPKVVWLPTDNTARAVPGGINTVPGGTSNGLVSIRPPAGTPGTVASAVVPVLNDNPFFGTPAGASLSDIYNSGYRLRRLVGKIFVSLDQTQSASPTNIDSVIVTVGFIILRVNAGGAPQNIVPNIYATNVVDNIDAPWIWRRTWILSNFVTALVTTSSTGGSAYPENNATYGSVADGPHLDQKTARRVSHEARLFMVVSTMLMNTTTLSDLTVRVFSDVRVLGTLFNNAGNRGNSQR